MSLFTVVTQNNQPLWLTVLCQTDIAFKILIPQSTHLRKTSSDKTRDYNIHNERKYTVLVTSISSELSQQAVSVYSSRGWESTLPHAVVMRVCEGTFPPRQRSNLNRWGRVTLRLQHPKQDSKWKMCTHSVESVFSILSNKCYKYMAISRLCSASTSHCGLLGAVCFSIPPMDCE